MSISRDEVAKSLRKTKVQKERILVRHPQRQRMDIPVKVFQRLTALNISNTWALKLRRSTNWRGGAGQSMTEESEVGGLPRWFRIIIGFPKLAFSARLIDGIWRSQLARVAAGARATSMYAKLHAPMKRSTSASTMLMLALMSILLPRLRWGGSVEGDDLQVHGF